MLLFVCIRSESSQLPCEVGPIINTNFTGKKLRLRDVRQLAQGHTARTWQSSMGIQAVWAWMREQLCEVAAARKRSGVSGRRG